MEFSFFLQYLIPIVLGQATTRCSRGISVRLPPIVYEPATYSSDWIPPPPNYHWGNWKVGYSSQVVYHYLANFQVDHYGLVPNETTSYGKQVDLTSWSTNLTDVTNSNTSSVFGYDTPVLFEGTDTTAGNNAGVYRFVGEGVLATVTNSWQVLAWGIDSHGIEYRFEAETPAEGQGTAGSPAGINLLSRAEGGPTAATRDALFAAFEQKCDQYGAEDWKAILKNVTALPLDGRRTGLRPISCDKRCQTNAQMAA